MGSLSPVSHYMRRDFIRVGLGERLTVAEELMRVAMLRHLPVVEGTKLVGTLSHSEAQRALLDLLTGERGDASNEASVADWIQRAPEAIAPDSSLGDAALAMLNYRVGYLPVVERNGQDTLLVGIITKRDLLRIAYERGAFTD